MADLKAYFYVQALEKGGYQHNSISLAQGFRELGIPFSANQDYWQEPDGNLLFVGDPNADPADFDIVIVSEQYLTYGNQEFPPGFFDLPGKKVFLTTGDGMELHKQMYKAHYKRFDLIPTFLYGGLRHPGNFRAWSFGLSQHMIDFARPDLPKNPGICVNYRNAHSVRQQAQKRIFDQLPASMLDTRRDPFNWRELAEAKAYEDFLVYQSGGRHQKDYLERIASSSATATFGGHFYIQPWIWGWYPFKLVNYFVESAASIGRMNHLMKKIGLHTNHTYRIYQWDSWRFWESFASKSVAINVDFEKYRCILPVMPENGKHYLGVDLKNPGPSLKLLQNADALAEIGGFGHEWALQHYAPKAQAKRLLRYLE
ncbi:MAG TPA: hypothetical protein ENJ82_15700 [Bacteroidetes bacterium]|nr:hypothetical protein [Bacteroidota bacterium]